MRKIKNFKVNLRVREISRVIKKLVNVPEMPTELEEAVQKGCYFYSKFLSLSVVYDTFAKDSLDFIYDKDVPPKWVARSIYFLTIGSGLSEEFKKNEQAFGEHTGKIVSAVAVDALEQGKNFLQRLTAGEASDENCEISRCIEIPADLYEEAIKIVPADKIGVALNEGIFSPQYSVCGLFYWIPSKNKKK
ncbi:MAG: hypothetical protein FWF00_01775 [Endomicrobia bacterium]|nr:hypothetical protein [Endomicrobiia bacterium]MCL2506404.1 hypothetical protein [Endomicrobiia bacterium]